ncbi:MAG: hypothetical protein Q7K42_01905 [Candidatus Diapherotrites archaeon]|nr:hypothetical protein [Candidatus Diapherotrites archaeon]
MNSKGIGFASDVMIAFIVIFLMFVLYLYQFNSISVQANSSYAELKVQKKAIFIADSLIKNNSFFDQQKHRAMVNFLDTSSLDFSSAFEDDSVKELYLQPLNESKNYYKKFPLEGVCFSGQRFFVSGTMQKTLLGVTVCE